MNEDRLDKLGSGFASQVKDAAGKPILASVDTVSELLRALLTKCIDRRGDYLEGKPEAADAMQKDSEEARSLGDLLNGMGPRASDYFLQPWNSPDQMGRYLIDTYALDCQPDEAAYCVLMALIGETYSTVDYIADNGGNVEDDGWQIDGLIETYTHALLGLEDPNADE